MFGFGCGDIHNMAKGHVVVVVVVGDEVDIV